MEQAFRIPFFPELGTWPLVSVAGKFAKRDEVSWKECFFWGDGVKKLGQDLEAIKHEKRVGALEHGSGRRRNSNRHDVPTDEVVVRSPYAILWAKSLLQLRSQKAHNTSHVKADKEPLEQHCPPIKRERIETCTL